MRLRTLARERSRTPPLRTLARERSQAPTWLRTLAGGVVVMVQSACATARPSPVVAAATMEPRATGSTTRATARCDLPLPTYLEVRPILEHRCNRCHAGDGPAAEDHDWSRIETLRAQRRSLADDVASRAMPPAGEPPLSDAEAKVLATWALCGAPER
jgi:uncharacterized membrane protein